MPRGSRSLYAGCARLRGTAQNNSVSGTRAFAAIAIARAKSSDERRSSAISTQPRMCSTAGAPARVTISWMAVSGARGRGSLRRRPPAAPPPPPRPPADEDVCWSERSIVAASRSAVPPDGLSSSAAVAWPSTRFCPRRVCGASMHVSPLRAQRPHTGSIRSQRTFDAAHAAHVRRLSARCGWVGWAVGGGAFIIADPTPTGPPGSGEGKAGRQNSGAGALLGRNRSRMIKSMESMRFGVSH